MRGGGVVEGLAPALRVAVGEDVTDGLAPTVREGVGLPESDSLAVLLALAPTVSDAVGLALSVLLAETVDEGVTAAVSEPETAGDEVALEQGVAGGVALLDRDVLAVCKETVEEGVLLVERVGLVEGVSLEVPEPVPEPVPVPMPELELDGVPVGVLLEVAVDEKEVVREMLPELLALAPSVRDPVGEADTELEALRVVLGVSLPVPEALCVPVLVGVPEGVVEGVGVDLWLGEPLKLAALVAVPVRVVL